MEQPVVKKLSVQSDKMSDRSTELTIWMSHQIVGKTSCPDKQGIGELREENLRIKQGMGGNWELNLDRNFNQMSLMQRDTTIWPDLSYFVAPKENKNTRKYFISNLFSEKFTCHSNKYENLMILWELWGDRIEEVLYMLR